MLLQVFLGEDTVNFVTEGHIVDIDKVACHSEVAFQVVVFLSSELHLLAVEHTSELLTGQVALAEGIMVLEEFVHTDAIFLYHVLDLAHQVQMLLLSTEVQIGIDVCGLGTCRWAVNFVDEAVSIGEEVGITDVVVFIAVDHGDLGNFLFT